ncbi:DUF7620 family protein [Streptomyces misionensis]|uniref:DUF7620 family protein n=1 Tax=Streptomyces misionensis TaxID=67331 RepID=UPI00396BCDF6
MPWISRLLRRRPKPAPRSDSTPGQREAESALSHAVEARQQVEALWPVVNRRSSRLVTERERNHFAEMFRSALEGGRN